MVLETENFLLFVLDLQTQHGQMEESIEAQEKYLFKRQYLWLKEKFETHPIDSVRCYKFFDNFFEKYIPNLCIDKVLRILTPSDPFILATLNKSDYPSVRGLISQHDQTILATYFLH